MNWYIWNHDGTAVYENSIERAKEIYGIERAPDLTLTEEEFNNVGHLARVVNGEIVLGFTADENKATHNSEIQKEIDELRGRLLVTDYIAAKIAEGAATREEYAEQLTQRQAWRDRINELEAELEK